MFSIPIIPIRIPIPLLLLGLQALTTTNNAAQVVKDAAANSINAACLAVDTSDNVYLFGAQDGKDYLLGASSSLSQLQPTQQPTQLSSSTNASSRPDFIPRPSILPQKVQCLFAEYRNSIYFVNADSRAPSTTLYVYNFGSKSWSTLNTIVPPGMTISIPDMVLTYGNNIVSLCLITSL
jgi:hypothetical protein